MTRFTPDESASALLAPLGERLAAAAARLPPGPPLAITVGEVEGFYSLQGDRLVLSEALAGPALHHPAEDNGPLPPLDRWRRALGCVLEGLALAGLAAEADRPPGEQWFWRGAAIDAADRAAPELGLAGPDLARAVERADPGRWPRSGVAVLRAWADRGEDPRVRALAAIAGRLPDPDEWLALGHHILSAETGPARTLPVPLGRAPEAALPLEMSPWSWRMLSLGGGRVGARVEASGAARVEGRWVCAGDECRALAACAGGAGGARLVPGGPVGTWAMTSGQGFGQMMGARGLEFGFKGSGALEILLADAFVGPLPAVEVAERMGTSGVINGRWAVTGPARLRLFALVPMGLTVHGREDNPFAVPAPGAGLESYLKDLEGSEWAWERRGDRLILRGDSFGPTVELRFKQA